MKTYDVYQQQHPINTKVDGPSLSGPDKPKTPWEVNLVHVGQVRAESGAEAIDTARQTITAFRIASRRTLAAFPVVEPRY